MLCVFKTFVLIFVCFFKAQTVKHNARNAKIMSSTPITFHWLNSNRLLFFLLHVKSCSLGTIMFMKFACAPSGLQSHEAHEPARSPSMLSAVRSAMDSLHLPVARVSFLRPLPQEDQQRLHYDVYTEQSQNGRSCERLSGVLCYITLCNDSLYVCVQVLGLILWIVCWTDLFSSFHEISQNKSVAPVYFVTPLIVGMTMVSANRRWMCWLCPVCLILLSVLLYSGLSDSKNFLACPKKASFNNDSFS